MKNRIFLIALLSFCFSSAQVYTFSSEKEGKTITHRIMIDANYLVETQFVSDPAAFILTRGGFYTKEGTSYEVDLEFNSNLEKDNLKTLELVKSKTWKKSNTKAIDLNGKWLMAGRMTEEGERRRDTSGPRKTMKFLLDGYFQWIAFNTETFQFFGSGGGFYTTENGIYTENIEFFSRNNKSVGRVLPFQYSVKGVDWHHQGKSSKGEPMHEIWTQRVN
jgi:hypothetical protein